jgi:hypothetical protein
MSSTFVGFFVFASCFFTSSPGFPLEIPGWEVSLGISPPADFDEVEVLSPSFWAKRANRFARLEAIGSKCKREIEFQYNASAPLEGATVSWDSVVD